MDAVAAMLFSKRHEWMQQKLMQSFSLDAAVAEKALRDNKKRVDVFLSEPASPPKLFFFYQPRYPGGTAELFLSVGGEGERLDSKAVYFLRDSNKPVNLKQAQDATVLSGEIGLDILQSFQASLSEVYFPLLQQQSEWGRIKAGREKSAFLESVHAFQSELSRKIANLHGDLQLAAPPAPYDSIEQKPAAFLKASKDKQTVDACLSSCSAWCAAITGYLAADSSNQPIAASVESGPEVEIDYWSRRMLTLISITEQLKGQACKGVIGVLRARAGRSEVDDGIGATNHKKADEDAAEQEACKQLLERWREVDLQITDGLNEAKDNVRFLDNLRQVIDPLYTGQPRSISDGMGSLMSSMKMIHTLSRYYGTDVRMTNLFQRITNQIIANCRHFILHGPPVATSISSVHTGSAPAANGDDAASISDSQRLWQTEPSVLISRMQDSISLYDAYLYHYRLIRQKLSALPKGKQFHFDESAIFSKLTRFRRRLEKLCDMFSAVDQFRELRVKRLDGLDELLFSFEKLVADFRAKNAYDLLEYGNVQFERDFVEFTMHCSGLENALTEHIGKCLTACSSIDKQLDLMVQFSSILSRRQHLSDEMEQKYCTIFRLYGDELNAIQQLYEKYRENPPLARNCPRVAGNIQWSRQLLRRITQPMKSFQLIPKVFVAKESKKIVKHYNKLAKTLIEFESVWYNAWCNSSDMAKQGLRSRLIVQDSNDSLLVNFDVAVLTLIKEAKHLSLMGFDIPASARIILLLESKLKSHSSQLTHALSQYNRMKKSIPAIVLPLLAPHLQQLSAILQPAMTVMTWTSLNVDSFLSVFQSAMAAFSDLVQQCSDIIHSRIEKNLQSISKTAMFDLCKAGSVSLKDFMTRNEAQLSRGLDFVNAKNEEVERAVDDLIDAIGSYKLTGGQQQQQQQGLETEAGAEVSAPAVTTALSQLQPAALHAVKLRYQQELYQAIVTAVSRSLRELTARLSDSSSGSPPLFELDVSLSVPSVSLSPSLSELEETVTSLSSLLLASSSRMLDWGIDLDSITFKKSRHAFHDALTQDASVQAAQSGLAAAVSQAKEKASEYMKSFSSFHWLWSNDPEVAYRQFVQSSAVQPPLIEDFIVELHKFSAVEQSINDVGSDARDGFSFRTESLKSALKHEVERWKYQYSEKLHQSVKGEMDALSETMHDIRSKLEREVKDFATLKFVMDVQAEIRDMQSYVDLSFDSIIDRYNILEKYLPGGVMTKDEMDTKSVLKTQWAAILAASQAVMTNIQGLQSGFKQDLLDNVRVFKSTVKGFRADYELNGPMSRGVSPLEAITRLNKYKREFETLNRKYDLYAGGEKLFGLPSQSYPDLEATKKELKLLDQLYTLYQQVISTVDEYKSIPWAEVVANIAAMNETVEGFSERCRRLPKGLKSWEAFVELNRTIEEFLEILPLLTELSKPAMRDRHWKKISQLTGKEFEVEKFHEMKLRTVLEAGLLQYHEDIIEITDSAEKQLAIERKLTEIQQLWDVQSFEFAAWKERGDVILAGSTIAETIEQLEDSQASLIQMLTQRHVTPFREQANGWLKKLSDVNDTLESWIKVQMLWMSLESVFTGGDIARQMPSDTRVFMKVDKEWTTRLMNKAKDVKNVVDSCQNEYIKNMLPAMFSDLEKCQKALDGYLEQKRLRFPRFYFVSNPALLLILSQGSDKEAVQQCFSKVFDSIHRVEFAGANITKIKSLSPGYDGQDCEDITLSKPVAAKGNIEDWLTSLLKEMKRTLKDIVRAAATEFESMQWSDFIAKYCAQVTLLGIQFCWTSDVQEALIRLKHDKAAIVAAFKKQSAVLTELSNMTTQEIRTKMERTKVETLVTIQVHQRDVLQELLSKYKDKKLKDVYDFEWQKQLRCYWQQEEDECVIKIADVDFPYCYESIGCTERLVVTPLTDRCYVSLSQALGMSFGGAPAGPAGTGKTETTKDLGRALGKLVVVFNCSDQMHTADTAKIFKGLCQSGSWGCFDEFNRINLEVLSVVAQQVQAVLTAVRARAASFVFPGDDTGEILLDDKCGFFITMNPGYAGRQELPENLKALFRSCAMMVPDREIIIKVKLASVGYLDFAILAKKFRVLYGLCEEQLSKQRHYDFGLRNILSVLRTAGINLRLELGKEAGQQQERSQLEEMIMMRTLRDMNLSKLVADDVDLFIQLLHDLFPNQKDPEKRRYEKEEEAMKQAITDLRLVQHESWVNKIIQLYETSLVRHGLMMVGPSGGGKTAATRVLIDALTASHEKHLMVRMNPKAIRAEEMFGENDAVSAEWTPGIFSALWQKYNDTKKPRTWIVCDGPVDAIWIENLNSVLDDNKLLTLANGDRLPMTDNVRLLFEVQDLRNASPATVSRAGIVFVSSTDLGCEPIVTAWLRTRKEEESALLSELYAKYVTQPELFSWLGKNTRNVMRVSDVHLVTNCLDLLQGLLGAGNTAESKVHSLQQLERVFLYCLCWSLGSLLESDDRIKFSSKMAEIAGSNVPSSLQAGGGGGADETLYDWCVNEESLEWERWEAPEWQYQADSFNFSTCLVPTVDSSRAEFLIDVMLQKLHRPVLILGSTGTAKTSIILQYTNGFDNSKMLLKKVNFSSATTAGMFQTSMEADIEKRQGKTYAPPGGRLMTVFLDDISMPEVNKWGDQPTLELVRQLIESGGFYFLQKDKRGDKMQIENVAYVAAMSHPGGGRNDIPDRLKRHFFVFNMTPPSHASIDNIYGSMLRGRFDSNPALLSLVPLLTAATIELWQAVKSRMLPTPSKFHYIFNMRELARVFQGVLFSPLEVVAKGNTLLQLWKHECQRVFSDKLTNHKDKRWFEETIAKVMTDRFAASDIAGVKDVNGYFVDFLRDEVVDEETEEVLEDAPKVYEAAADLDSLRKRVEEFLSRHNAQTGVKAMPLVLFSDALEHMMRISRIIGMPRGNALLVGVGGSGRQSLTRLAAYIARQDVFQIQITRSYKMADFLDDVRKLYVAVGKEGKRTTWILTDFDIVNEEFLEYINAILTTGEVAGLFPKDERDMMCSDLRTVAKKENRDFVDTPDNLYSFFLSRLRDNLHIVLCFSPANDKFAERARRFPGLISGCTIDWFLRWPEAALVDVSFKFLTEDKAFKVEADARVEKQLVRHIATVHNLVTEACDEYFQKFRRHVYVTPKSYLSYIKSYKEVYRQKLSEIATQQRNVETGLKKLKEAEVDVNRLQGVLEQQNIELGIADKAATAMLQKLEVSAKEANGKKQAAEVIEAKCTKAANTINEERAVANKELEAAMPFVRAAEKAARSVNKKDIGIIQKLGKPPDLIKRIMDCVLILNCRPLDKISMTEIKTGKTDFQMFIADSYDSQAKKMMVENGFVNTLLDFATDEKDNINEETMEFLDPYLACVDFTAERAKTVSSAAEGLLKWVRAMASYHTASLIVGPKLEQLQIKTNQFNAATAKLRAAQAQSKAAQDEVDKLQEQFENTMKEKAALEHQAKETGDKMIAANNLIKSLAGEKKRWQADALVFAEDKKRLVGNCALACAFVSYLGPFNHEFRKKLLTDYFLKDCISNAIPVSKDLDLNKFLVDDGTIAEWNSQGLPKDDLSIQNGILVTQASRWPLLIDPQGQALTWLKKREAANFPVWGTTTLQNPKLRDQLEFCMENGSPLLVEGVVKELDPMLDPVLEKNVISRGRSFYIMLGDKQVSMDPAFRVYFITKLSNPLFSPELSAKSTIIDFSVTQKGLEDQLLSRVIQTEQKSLEDQRQKLIEEVNANTISLQSLDKQLLERLSASSGNLLDDVALIGVLADTKTKAQEVKEKIEASVTTEQMINKRREHYRPVATRGSVIYFVIVSMAAVNCMYQTSLAQFLQWFDLSMQEAEKANLVQKRVEILMKHLTYEVYININRGLFEVDKLTFKLMVTMKILVTEGEAAALDEKSIRILLRGGAGLNLLEMPKKPFDWLQQSAWLNLLALTYNIDFFSDLKGSVESNEAEWRKWYEAEAPESVEIPRLEDRLQSHPSGSFMRFLIVRSFRDDRTRLAANAFIGTVLGERYIEPAPASFEEIHRVSDNRTPVILLLTPGADPTSQLEELAKKKGVKISPVSMGEGQEPHATKSVTGGMEEGAWSLLQNCHLGLGFMNKLDELIHKCHEEKEVDPAFRLWITCEPHPDFPINLLQMSVKVTNEPPRGMKAGLLRSYTSVVDSERLGRVETKEWRDMVFTLCFLHSTVQERRKFGAQGWCWGRGTRLVMADATLKPVEDIVVGDVLSGDDGNFVTVQRLIRGNTGDDAQKGQHLVPAIKPGHSGMSAPLLGKDRGKLSATQWECKYLGCNATFTTPQSRTKHEIEMDLHQNPHPAPAMYRITPTSEGRLPFTCNGGHTLVVKFSSRPRGVQQWPARDNRADPWYYSQFALTSDGTGVASTSYSFRTQQLADAAYQQADAVWKPLVACLTVEQFLKCSQSVRSIAQLYSPAEVSFRPPQQPLKLRLSQLLQARGVLRPGQSADDQLVHDTAWTLGLWLADGSPDSASFRRNKVDEAAAAVAHWQATVSASGPSQSEANQPDVDEEDDDAMCEEAAEPALGHDVLSTLLHSYAMLNSRVVPAELLQEAPHIRLRVLAGLMDGSCLESVGDRYQFSTIQRPLMDSVKTLARSLGCTVGKEALTEYGQAQPCLRIRISGQPVYSLPVVNKRARPSPGAAALGDANYHDTLCCTFTVDKIDHADYFGIELDGNRRCLLEDFVVTHNCIPYEFNTSDLEASLTFLEKHCFSTTGLSWPTVRYMVSQVQYGGRITDDMDAVLFQTFAKLWLSPEIFKDDFTFSSSHFTYSIPQSDSIEGYRNYITTFPPHDSPEIFGLHVNADLTFGTNEALYILNTISDTQPKESGAKAGAKTREEAVFEKADELLALCPKPYKDDEVRELVRKRSKLENEFVLGYKPEEKVDGFSIPLNIFLYQEITRLNRTIANVRSTLTDLKSAINGEIIMTPELQAALTFVFNEKPPKHWYTDASGSEIAWYLPSLALWFAGLLDREKQLTQWLQSTRPITYWLTGFFNPQGFLTATRQEITRRHKAEKWALDDVVLVSTVTEHTDLRRIKYPPAEGVYIHGLYLEGASWDKRDGGRLSESHAKELYTPLPVLLVTAVTSKQAEKLYSGGKDDARWYDCPVYTKPKRTGLNYVFSVKLRTNVDPEHWVLRGVALLCSKD